MRLRRTLVCGASRRPILLCLIISPPDLSLFRITDSVDHAVDEIMRFYSVYHSARYVRDKLILRLQREPSEEVLAKLNEEFADLLESGTIARVPTHPHELDDEFTRDLPRLSLHFNRRDAGRLRLMIDWINRELA